MRTMQRHLLHDTRHASEQSLPLLTSNTSVKHVPAVKGVLNPVFKKFHLLSRGFFPDILDSAERGEQAAMWQYHWLSDKPFCDVQAVPEDMGPLQFAAGSQRHDLGRCCLVQRHHSKCTHAHTEPTLLTAYEVDAAADFCIILWHAS